MQRVHCRYKLTYILYKTSILNVLCEETYQGTKHSKINSKKLCYVIILCHVFGQVIPYRLALGEKVCLFVFTQSAFCKNELLCCAFCIRRHCWNQVPVATDGAFDCTQMPLLYSRRVSNNAVILHLYLLTPRMARARTLSNKLFNQVYFTQSLIVTVCFFIYLN